VLGVEAEGCVNLGIIAASVNRPRAFILRFSVAFFSSLALPCLVSTISRLALSAFDSFIL